MLAVRLPGQDRPDAFTVVERTLRHLDLTPFLSLQCDLPGPGATVVCTGTSGDWETTVLPAPAGLFRVAVPAWMHRSTTRTSRRVGLHEKVHLTVEQVRWAAHLVNLSASGAALRLEAAARLRVGSTLLCHLPSGTAAATVRRLGQDEHPLLSTVGVSWSSTDAGVRQWIAQRITAAAQRQG
ncbi:MAG: PilZ domain-containing protein [Motilibacteraceae bacterium]